MELNTASEEPDKPVLGSTIDFDNEDVNAVLDDSKSNADNSVFNIFILKIINKNDSCYSELEDLNPDSQMILV